MFCLVWVLSKTSKGLHVFPLGEWASFQVNVADLSWSGGLLVQVTNLQLVRPALVWCSAMLTVGATILNLPRIEIQMTASVIGMLKEFATDELEDMEGEHAGRCNSLSHSSRRCESASGSF